VHRITTDGAEGTRDAAHTAFTLKVKLAPGRTYGILFTGFYFAAADGFPLQDCALRLKTKGR
jgi:hypothetical protein